MFTPKLDEVIEEFFDSLPPGLKTFNQEMENLLKQFLLSWFEKMSLVTQEEFDIQSQVLAKTRQKLHQLEAILAALSLAKD